MKHVLAIIAAFTALVCSADTNELERLRVEFLTARKAYMDARKAAGLTNAAPKRIATPTTRTTFSDKQKKYFENRRICVSRDTETIPGSVITAWYRNGKPDTKGQPVVTNVLHNIAGAMQNNPLQVLAERYRLAASDATRRLAEVTEDYMSASNRADRAEARHAAIVAWAEEQRDKAILSTTKAVWQSIIDRLEENQ